MPKALLSSGFSEEKKQNLSASWFDPGTPRTAVRHAKHHRPLRLTGNDCLKCTRLTTGPHTRASWSRDDRQRDNGQWRHHTGSRRAYSDDTLRSKSRTRLLRHDSCSIKLSRSVRLSCKSVRISAACCCRLTADNTSSKPSTIICRQPTRWKVHCSRVTGCYTRRSVDIHFH